MSKYRYLLFTIIFLVLSTSCKLFDKESKDKDVLGCIDEAAQNFNPEATKDDGSCDYCTGELGDSFLLLTYDGGQSWEKKCINIEASNIIDISIVDSNNIWVCTSPSIVGQSKAQILHSSDGGYTWEEQYEDTNSNNFFNYVEMFDENNGIAMGDGKNYVPLFLKTSNGGDTWTSTTIEQIGVSGDIWRRLDFIDVENGYFYGSKPGWNTSIHKTENSGTSWSSKYFADNSNVWVLKFYDKNLGLMSVNTSEVFRTTDGGNTWSNKNVDFGGAWALDIEFHPTNPELVWIGNSSDYLYFSNDGGINWTKEPTAFTQTVSIWDIYSGNNSVWCAGYHKDRELFMNRNIEQSSWEQIQLPLTDNMTLEGIIDGVGDNIIVLPGHYYQ